MQELSRELQVIIWAMKRFRENLVAYQKAADAKQAKLLREAIKTRKESIRQETEYKHLRVIQGGKS